MPSAAASNPARASAAGREGYRAYCRGRTRPVVINTKGASASGKSTLRPLQKKLAGDIGVNWSDFALISPDIWRKQLLDYGSLGAPTNMPALHRRGAADRRPQARPLHGAQISHAARCRTC